MFTLLCRFFLLMRYRLRESWTYLKADAPDKGGAPRISIVQAGAGWACLWAVDRVGGGSQADGQSRWPGDHSLCPFLFCNNVTFFFFFFLNNYIAIPWYPWRTDSRTHTDTKICRCSSPRVCAPYQEPQIQSISARVQLILEQDGFELYRSTYMRIFCQLISVKVNSWNIFKKIHVYVDLCISNSHCSRVNCTILCFHNEKGSLSKSTGFSPQIAEWRQWLRGQKTKQNTKLL